LFNIAVISAVRDVLVFPFFMLLTTSCSGSECNNCCDQRAWVASAQIFTLLSHNRDHMAWSLYYCLLVPLTCGCYFSRTSCLWWIAHSTPLLL